MIKLNIAFENSLQYPCNASQWLVCKQPNLQQVLKAIDFFN